MAFFFCSLIVKLLFLSFSLQYLNTYVCMVYFFLAFSFFFSFHFVNNFFYCECGMSWVLSGIATSDGSLKVVITLD